MLMMTRSTRHAIFERAHQRGTTLLEVLVTILILVFGLLGFVAMQSRIAAANVDAHARAQAILLLSDMVGRIDANRANAAAYVASDIGTGDSQPTDCTGVAAGAARDTCEWSNAMKGAGEAKASVRVGAMTGARGCIEQIEAPNPAPGVCTRGIYRVTVVWQGMIKTAAPAISCGQNQFGAEEYRRAVSARVAVGLPSCV
jgi:type IV pilus assembly protein PilV